MAPKGSDPAPQVIPARTVEHVPRRDRIVVHVGLRPELADDLRRWAARDYDSVNRLVLVAVAEYVERRRREERPEVVCSA
jgi:hypothetical protein